MPDHSKAFEITITVLGLIVTGVLGYGQYQLSSDQSKLAAVQHEAEQKRSVDNIEVQVMSLVAPHLGNLAKAGGDFDSSQKVVLAAAEYLSSQHGRRALAAMASKISEGNATLSAEVKTRFQEATSTVTPSARWFAVLASLPAHDEGAAKSAANKSLQQLKSVGEKNKVQLWRTKISNNFAIILGGAVERNAAIDLAATARKLGVAKDAFAQQDREWILIGTAPFKL